MNEIYDFIVVGGGAAGFFAALTAKEFYPTLKVAILEKNAALLSKVRISGGGRCNLTHACYEPRLLVQNYPRGAKELLAPFFRFQPKDTIHWFESRGVSLKEEADGRLFPVSNQSQSIIDCLLQEAEKLGVEIRIKQKIEQIEHKKTHFELSIKNEEPLRCKKLLLATGSSPQGHAWAETLGHTLITPVPSLFTFNAPSSPFKSLSGISFKEVRVSIKGTSHTSKGPLLLTHFGFSGPVILKLSSWAARTLYEKKYSFDIAIDWLPHLSLKEITEALLDFKNNSPQKKISSDNPFQLPKKFWKSFLQFFEPISSKNLKDLSFKEISNLSEKLHKSIYSILGKTTHKEEFVTAGGVKLKEVHFKTMESKICPNLFFAGEILDIDALTGGFNFQNAWTTGFIAGSSI